MESKDQIDKVAVVGDNHGMFCSGVVRFPQVIGCQSQVWFASPQTEFDADDLLSAINRAVRGE